jgi:GWxTD domain-containing protein
MLLLLITAIAITGVTGFAKKKLDPESEDFYKYARYLFTKNERKIFLNLPTPEERREFIKYFWEIRDPNPYTEENEFKLEMEQRFEFVSKYLKEGPVPGWKTDRGRIHILLGPPHNRLEEPFPPVDAPYKGIIYWYYEDTNILAVFVDTKGNGFYRMDLTRTSMRLLDELDNRKHYIADTEAGKFSVDILKFNVSYDPKEGKLIFEISTKNVFFDKDGSNMTSKFKMDLMVYYGKKKFLKHSEVKTVQMNEDDILKKNAKIKVEIPFKLPEGKVKVDAIVTDFLGNATSRKLVTLKDK